MRIRAPHEEMEEAEQEIPEMMPQQEMIPQMAVGGMVDPFRLDDSFSVDGGASATAKAPPVPPQVASLPPSVAAAPPQAPIAEPPPHKPLPGMPPDVSPDELKQYLDKQRGQINKFSPDQQYGQEMAMLNARSGFGPSLGRAGATFADALMQGVARAGNPGFSKQLEDRLDTRDATATGAMERARKGTMEQTSANQQIDLMDPRSTMSKTYQQTFGPLFREMGYSPEDVARMPASQIHTIAELGIKHEDAQTALLLKKAMLGVQALTANATITNQQAQRKHEALGDLSKMPWYSRILHPGIAGELEKSAGLGGGDHPETADAEAWAKANPNDPRAAEIMKRIGK